MNATLPPQERFLEGMQRFVVDTELRWGTAAGSDTRLSGAGWADIECFALDQGRLAVVVAVVEPVGRFGSKAASSFGVVAI